LGYDDDMTNMTVVCTLCHCPLSVGEWVQRPDKHWIAARDCFSHKVEIEKSTTARQDGHTTSRSRKGHSQFWCRSIYQSWKCWIQHSAILHRRISRTPSWPYHCIGRVAFIRRNCCSIAYLGKVPYV